MLAVALLPVVAAPLAGEPGTTHAAWHVAAVALQLIMQLVVAELCARRSDLLLLAAADPAPIALANGNRTQIASAARTPFSPCRSRRPQYRDRARREKRSGTDRRRLEAGALALQSAAPNVLESP